jgi:arylsulfatase A-like enzyme
MGKSGEAFGDESAKNAKTHAAWVQQVNECVLSLDEGIGEVLKTLRETGQLQNTLVVFSADQGFSMGEHGFRTKLAPYDANYASPLIISQPGTLPEGKVCSHPVNAPDLVATFFARAGLEQPWKMHGRNLSPLLTDPELADWPHACLYEHTGQKYGSDVTDVLKAGGKEAVHNNVPWYTALRHGRFKYIRYLQPGNIDELYDLETDPEELTNLAGTPEHARHVADLRAKLTAELRRTGADFIDLLPTPASN